MVKILQWLVIHQWVIAKGQPINLVKQVPIILNQYRTLNAKVPLDSTGRARTLIAGVKAKTNITITPTNTIIQFHEGSSRYHNNLNLAKAQAIKVYENDRRTRPTSQGAYKVRVTRNQLRREQEIIQAEEERQRNNEKEEKNHPDTALGTDPTYVSTDTEDVTHPHYKDTIVQKTLAHKKLMRRQGDDEKLYQTIRETTARQFLNQRTFAQDPTSNLNNRIKFHMVEGVLYTSEENQWPGKPVLPSNMVEGELYRSHIATPHRGIQATIDHVRERYHHSKATSEESLETTAKTILPCSLCMWRQKITLTRGVLPYPEARSILMTLGGY
jgi:hypothetical protein